ncbi:Apoptosis-inducing factor 2 [Vitis vinifera]|uniref:Apoptosis-inducing factor 2 n=1 Tax=Vitis vinifera TaxID=29760 RepID=A0A438GEG8_VITVI|nr:Apoptosis-inducing factor 2 [Vitis vinifera]
MATEELPPLASDIKRVVILGGGIAGSLLAKSLQFRADIFLVDPKEYFEIPWASLRAMVEPSFAERTVINHSDLPYQWATCCIYCGHLDHVPKTRTERLKQYQADKICQFHFDCWRGPTGVELAGEIVVDFPDKKVTLVHRGSRLLEFIGAKASKKALDWLTSKKVEVLLNQSVDINTASDGTYQTSGGETIIADCHFVCTGKPIGSSWLKDTILKDNLDGHGKLVVDDNLRVRGLKNVFAIGDITAIPEIQQGYLAQRHAVVAAKNIKMLMSGEKETKLATYKPGSAIAIVSLGRRDAVAQLPFATICGCIPGMIKSRDLFVGKTRKQMGLKPTLT